MSLYYRGGKTNNTSRDPCATSLEEYPNVFREGPYNYTNIAICLVISLYLFWAMAIICDDYLIPAVEAFCNKVHMPYDIGGATLMAGSSSMSELFICFITTLISKSDMGISTILGSSVFNTLAVAGVCGLVCKKSLVLDWWPITREILWYMSAICVMGIVISDERVSTLEATAMLGCYALNVICLLFDRRIQSFFRKTTTEEKKKDQAGEEADGDAGHPEGPPIVTIKETICIFPKKKNCLSKLSWIISWPIQLLFSITTPRFHVFMLGTMLMSIVWTGVLTYICTWTMTIIGFNLHIPESVLGLTILAFGTSVPEAVMSYVVAKQGYGEMAICNTVSSNTINVYVSLGFPWFVATLYFGTEVVVETEGLAFLNISLMGTALLLEVVFVLTKFHLGRLLGCIALTSFLIYVTGASVYLYFQCK